MLTRYLRKLQASSKAQIFCYPTNNFGNLKQNKPQNNPSNEYDYDAQEINGQNKNGRIKTGLETYENMIERFEDESPSGDKVNEILDKGSSFTATHGGPQAEKFMKEGQKYPEGMKKASGVDENLLKNEKKNEESKENEEKENKSTFEKVADTVKEGVNKIFGSGGGR